MKIVETPIEGVYVIEIEPACDDRGFFARTYCDRELSALLPHIAQSSISFNTHRGTVRGMHYQRAPYAEAKLVRCSRGAVYDVVVDLRTGRWFGTELTQDNGRMLFVPEGFAQFVGEKAVIEPINVPLLAVDLSPDGKTLATAGSDRLVRIWDIETGEELQRFEGHRASITAVRFLPDGIHLVSASLDRTVRFWTVAQ